MKTLLLALLFALSLNLAAQGDTVRYFGKQFRIVESPSTKKFKYQFMVFDVMLMIDTPLADSTDTHVEASEVSVVSGGVEVLNVHFNSAPTYDAQLAAVIDKMQKGGRVTVGGTRITNNKNQHMTGLVKPLTLERL